MGKINAGILGGVSGKIGNVIGSSWKGIDYIRIMPTSITDPETNPQLVQRQKMSVMVAFCQPLSEFLRTGFKAFAVKMSGYNAALSYNMKHAITGTYPSEVVDYASALVARGTLAGPLNQVASSLVAGTVKFDWEDNTGEIGALATDKTLLVVLNPSQHQAVTVSQLTQRDDGTQTVTVPNSFSGDLCQCYMAYIKADGTTVSNSGFCGAVTVA
jgi:hypothetical protein